MSGSLIPLRYFVVTLVVIVGLLFWPLKVLQWVHPYACTDHKTLHISSPIIQLGRVQINSWSFDCPDSQRYDPRLFHPSLSQDLPTNLPSSYGQ